MTTEESLLRPVTGLIEDISAELLSFGAREYKKRGRGVVVVCSPHFQSDGDAIMVPFDYMTEQDSITRFDEPWPDDEIASMVNDYTPKTEAIVIWVRRDKSLEYYRLAK